MVGPGQNRPAALPPQRLYPALTVEPQATVTDFDAEHPDGADYASIGDRQPAPALDDALRAIEARYGRGTAAVVAMQGAPR